MSDFIIGIDLGTTNCALSFVDLREEEASIEPFEIEQLVAAGESLARLTLPSFLLLPTETEVPSKGMSLPWSDKMASCVGIFARERGAEIPHRLVSSAKSWLSNQQIDRNEAILPWRGEDDDFESGESISPVDASAKYLQHLSAAWMHSMETPMEDQEIYITVPASFDASARQATAEAADKAGFTNVTLMEEPQAAFYSWLEQSDDAWRKTLQPGDVALVCDIGGGTSDFSLITAENDGQGNLGLERIAVGEHLLLGGDNMDLMLSYVVKAKLGEKAKKLSSSQERALVQNCRHAKETLFNNPKKIKVPITILGSGSKLIGGTIKSDVTQEDLEKLTLGFFPPCKLSDSPKRKNQTGLREVGLPYASDPAITKHLASFLSKHEKLPNKVLFNGGVMSSPSLQEHLLGVLKSWAPTIDVLSGTQLDLAVAQGAAYYGLVKQGNGIRIKGGTARSYYVGIESSMPAIPGFEPPLKAMCVAPFGMEEGTHEDLPDEELGFVVGEPTTFRFFSSTHRQEDSVGEVVDPSEADLLEMAPVETHLKPSKDAKNGEMVPVYLASHVTEVGTLELFGYHKNGNAKWKLEYSIREEEANP